MLESQSDIIIVDTEGKDVITEIALIDAQGELVFEGFVQDGEVQHDTYPLTELLQHFTRHVEGKTIVCHYADHDQAILRNSFTKADLDWPELEFICSYLMAKKQLSDLASYSLEFLSKHLNLQVNKQYFNTQAAHSARYDALFTRELYRKLLQQSQNQSSKTKPHNPFSNNRVDNPFQAHIDLDSIHHEEFKRMLAILAEIKADANQQSQGMVILGEAGNGKTHLMMRLAQQTMASNRLFFIRQPNHEEAVFYHIYSRILESFIEAIPNSPYSQLEYLLGRSFAEIVIKALNNKTKPTQKDIKIRDKLSQEQILPNGELVIYQLLGQSGADIKRRNWDYIERETLQWWQDTYGVSDYASNIIVGLIKYCRYSDIRKRELVRRWLAGQRLLAEELKSVGLRDWGEELSREDFALQAIIVFGKLSIVDEPLIIIFDQLEGLKHNETLLMRFGEAVKELFTHVPNSLLLFNLFPDRWRFFKNHFDDSVIERMGQSQINLPFPDALALKDMLALKLEHIDIDIDTLFDEQEIKTITNHRSIRGVLNCAADYYRYKIDAVPLPQNIVSFETRVEKALQALQQEIHELKQQLKLDNSPRQAIQLQPAEHAVIQDYIEQKQQKINNEYYKKIIISDTDDLGKLLSICDVLKSIMSFKLDYLRLGKRKLPEHVLIKTKGKMAVIGFIHLDASSFTPRIKNFNQLVINHQDMGFALFRDIREPVINSPVAKNEIEKLRNSNNASLSYMDQQNRVNFELVYQIISDIQNHDLHADLEVTMSLLMKHINRDNQERKYWLFRAMGVS
ncbi:MAG: 3'-5' exonuclease [Mariprofundales bacterium]